MSKGVALHLLVTIVIVVVKEGSTLPGTWLSKTVDPYDTVNMADMKWIPKGRNKLVFGIMSCADVTFTLYETSDQSNQYVLFYLGYYQNNYALIIPSSDCDDSGNCDIRFFSEGMYLDCSNFAFFWMSWDLTGKVTLGSGYEIGVGTLIDITNGLTVEPYYADVLFDDPSGGQIYVFIDDPPVPLNPLPDGTTVFEVYETNVIHNALYTAEASDPEADPVVFYVLDEYSDVFTFSDTTLTNIAPLDYEKHCEYAVKVTIYDGANIVTTMLTIKVLNVFDETPNVDAVSVSLPEELSIGSFIDSGLTVSDADVGDQLTYSLSGSHASYFEVTADGRFKVAARIDFDPPNSIKHLDQLTLIVTDLNSNSNSTTLTFAVTDVNDMKPTFSQAVYSAEVTEGSGTVSLLQLTITDADSGVNAEYDVTMDGDDPSDPAFTFDPSTLQLSVDANKLDYESLEASAFTSTLTFVATDKATEYEPRTGSTVALIKVLPDNEFTPVWSATPMDLTIDESSPPGTVIGSYIATDGDLSLHGDVTYQVVSLVTDQGVDAMGTFYLDSGTGELRVASPVDADTQTGGAAFYDITIQAADCCSKNVQASFKIFIFGENDNAPLFSEVSYQAELSEDAVIHSVVLDLQATDADWDVLTYTLLGNGNELFQYTSPGLMVYGPLDYETKRCFFLTLRASDGVHETDVPVNINIRNVIDEAPVLTVNTPISLTEEQPVGTPLGGVYDVTDRDENDTLTFSLEGSESSYFYIDSTTGVIILEQRIDREGGLTSISDVTLKVTDSGGNVASATLTFDIVDINDNSPQFSSDVIHMEVTENTPHDMLLSTLEVTDWDAGDNAEVVVSIISGDDDSPDEKFQLIGTEVRTSGTYIDYEALSSANFLYTLTVQAVDQPTTEAAKTAVAVVVVSVVPENERTPTWDTAPSDMTVSESRDAGSQLGHYTATDDDVGRDGDITYQLVSVTDDSGGDGSEKFHLDSGDGKLLLACPLDYDKPTGGAAYYDVTMKAVDGGVTAKFVETTFRISVGAENDNAPKFAESLYQAVVTEQADIHTSLFSVVANDADDDVLTYTLVGDGTDMFAYDDLNNLITSSTLDYESHRCYTFILRVNDGLHEVDVPVSINVSNVIDETPVLTVNTPIILFEEQPVDTPLGGVYVVTDRDEDDTFTYSLEGTGSSFFSIDPSSGLMTLAERMDREAGLTYITDVTLKVTDAGGNVASEALIFDIVDINDNSPQFSSDVIHLEVTENTPPDMLLSTLEVTDGDAGDNAKVVVSIISGDDDSPDEKFQLIGTEVRTSGTFIDYEALSSANFLYTLTVQAVDQPTTEAAKTAVAVVVVTVVSENEHTPTWDTAPSDMTVSESRDAGSQLGDYTATDDDVGRDGDVTYQLVSVTDDSGGDGSEKFHLDSGDGKLLLACPLDYDKPTGGAAYYDVTMKAVDGGVTALFVETTFRISVGAENDNAPKFAESLYQAVVTEQADIHTSLFSAVANDADDDVLTYTLVGDGTDMFAYDDLNNLITSSTLDYESHRCYTFLLRVNDGLHEVDVPVSINVSNVIDETPVLTVNTPIILFEEQPVDTPLGGVYVVTDRDEDDTFTYSLEGTGSSYFSIDPSTGLMTLAQRMDREASLTFITDVTLKVTDAGGNVASDALIFDIVDINDNSPRFSSDVIHMKVTENTPPDILLSTLEVTDGDAGDNAKVVVSIVSGDDDSPDEKFQLIGTEVRTSGTFIDYEALSSANFLYTLTVQAVDQPTTEAAKTAVAVVVVTVVAENEHTPTWDTAPSDMTVSESRDAGSQLGHYTATDDDVGRDGDVTYQLVSVTDDSGGDGSEKFHLDSGDGKLLLACPLDYDKPTGGAAYYDVTMKAVDGGVTALFVETTFRISVGAENDNAPKFAESLYQAVVTEQADIHTSLFSAVANDADDDVLTYTLVGDGTDMFAYDDLNNLITSSTLDYESHRCYTFLLRVNDGLHEVDVPVSINVSNVIDETPVLTVNTPIILFEEQPVDTPLGGVYVVTDRDEDDTFTYSLEGTGSSYFSIDPSTDLMTLGQRIDREAGLTFITDVTLKVTDAGGNVASETLTFDIVDINDNSPQFSSDVVYVNVSENTAYDQVIKELTCVDNDVGDNANIVYSIVSGDDSAIKFKMNGAALVTEDTPLNYESLVATDFMYILIVKAEDTPSDEASKSNVAVVVVKVLPENEFSPQFTLPAETSMTVTETTKPPYLLTTFNAADEDAGADGDVSYEILSVTDSMGDSALDKFLINPVSGELRLNDFLDADTATGGTDSYKIVVKATDAGATPMSTNRDFLITVENENDNAPLFLNFPTSIDVAETTDIGHALLTLTTEDNDGDDVVASIEDGDKALFIISGNNVILEQPLDFETSQCHTIVVGISDGTNKVNRTLVIKVTDVIDETPSIVSLTPVDVPEELPVGTTVGGLFLLTDLDRGDSHTFTLTGDDSHFFNIDADSGQVSIAERMDLESMSGTNVLDQLILTVTDTGGLQATADLSVVVVDINDATPVFAESVYKVNVSEGSPKEVLVDLVATDADSGTNGDISMQITAGDDPVTPRFELSGTQLSSLDNLDYESLADTQYMFLLTVEATDTPDKESPKTGVTMVAVTVLPENEFSPQFTLPAETFMTVTETTKPPYLLSTFNAVDEDAGADGDVSYEILSVTDSMGDSALDKFLINPVSGELRLNDFLDADTATGGTDSYNIVVKATDAGATPMSTNRDFLITLENENDNAPQFLNFPASIDVAETTDIGHALLTLTTEDNDGDDVVASIEDGDKTLFIISGNNVILEQPLDFETSQCHTIVVGISDGTNKINRTLVIKVTDVIDERPSIVTLTPVDVTEELPVGTTVGGLFLLTDLDRGDSHTFTLTGDDSHFFNIDDSGQVSIAERMDLESMSGANVLDQLILTVTDTGGLQATADLSVVIVDINDATPVFAESVYKVSVSEGSQKEVLVDLVATDADSGTNGDISMQITAGDDPVTPRFELSGTQLSSLDNLDYESLADTQYMFLLTVEATDSPDKESPKTGVTMVAVTVLPVNEFAPNWATSMSLTGSALPDLTMLENATVGSDLLMLEATDSDQGADGDVTYIVTSAITNTGESAEGLFTLNPVSGTLRTAGYLDRDVTTGEMYYDLTLTARDGGDPYKETSATLKIILDNVNDNAPEFTLSEYQIEVPESTAVDTAIYALTAADVDGDVVTYSIKEGDTDVFDVQGTSLVTRIALDYETVSWYSLLVEASDGLYTTTNLLLVKVTDVIDEKPVITVSNPVTVLEEMPIGTDVSWTFDVTDKDVTDYLLYSLSGIDKDYFNINPDTGELTVAMRLDREVKANIDLTLQVEDSSGLFTEADMLFTLADVNDMAPSFNANTHAVYTTEGHGDVDLMTLVVTDQDEADNAVFDVTITSGNDGGEFRLDGLVLKCDSSMMDYETASVNNYTYILSVQAVDKPTDGGSLTGSTVVIVHVQPQNEFEPAWEYPVLDVDGRFPQIHVDENIATGYVVITFDARDQDAGIDGDVTYDIISATDENNIDRSSLFTLDNNQGIIRTSGQLDFDQSTGGFESVSLVVQATDGGAVQKSSEGIQVILLYNVNDNPPHFTDAPSEVEVKENLDIDAVILDLQVVDHDGDAVTLTLSGSDAFQIVGTSITLQHRVDFESRQCHTVTVSALDGTHVSNISITIHVLNVMDEAPEVTLLPPLTLIEEQPIGKGIGWFFSVSDPDVNDTVTYTLSGSGADNFNLESSGELTIAKRIDRDSPGDVSFIDDLLLTVTDSAGLQTSVSWNLTVVDMNDNAPVCDVTGQVNITENSDEGIVMADIACTDLDSGEYGVVVLDLETATNQFKLSGTQLMTGGDPIDYEAIDDWNFVYNVQIVAVDNPAGEPRLTSTSIVTVKVLPVNEHTPVFKDIVGDGHFDEVSVAEDADVGAVVNTFVATDVDLGSDGHVTYGIQSVISDSGVQQDGLFTIDASSGQLRVSSQLDADAATGGVNNYTVNITATDAGSSPRSTHGALRVGVTGINDNAPVWNITDQEVAVFENASVGQDVVYLMADDVDGDAVTFSTSDTKFKVDGSMLKVEQQLDFEFQRCHTLTVSATDGKYTVDQTLVVHVLDSNDETPVVTVTKVIYIPEEIPVGTDVARGYIVSDADENDTLTFSLQGGDSDLLAINGTTGQLSLERRLDFETLTSASLDVKLHVTDVAGHTGTQALDIVVTDVNDNTPTFSSAIHRVKVTEQAAAETDLLTLEATDADDGINGEFSFNITDGNTHNLFRLDGNVLYAQPMDYEEAEAVDFTYSVTVTVVDHATDARTGVSVVVVEIIPENEYDPVLESVTEKSLPEDTEPGFEVLTVHATDADLGEDGVVTYDITSVLSDSNTDAPEKFTIDCDTGVLTTATELDFDPSTGGASYYDITINATDKGTVPRTSTAVLRVNINDINDIAPAFKDVSYTANVGCNDDVGSELMTLKADDEDGSSVGYTIDANPYLNVDSESGSVTLLDFPKGGAVSDLAQSVVVTASDDDLEGKCHLLVLFENCDNTTSVSTTTSATTSATTTTTNTPCPNVTCNCNSNSTVNDQTTSVTTTTATTTITTPTAAACVCNNATSAVSTTTTKPVTCPSDVTASPCVCSNTTTAAAAAAETDAGYAAEVWAMRALVVVMSMMIMAMVAVYLKNALTKVPQSTPINKVQPRTNSVERGIGSDDYGLKIEDFGKG